MTILNAHSISLLHAQVRAMSHGMGEPYASLPLQTTVARLIKHGGVTTLLDQDMMSVRIGALKEHPTMQANKRGNDSTEADTSCNPHLVASSLHAMASNFFYKLVDKEGYTVHSELMAYISEPGKGNGVSYDEGDTPASKTIPAAFTFVGQFIDHDLTFNGMNITADERGVVVADEASPVIDLDSMYGPRAKALSFLDDNSNPCASAEWLKVVFDEKGRFRHRKVKDSQGNYCGCDVPRDDDPCSPNFGSAIILDPRNDENQLILQLHILLQRYHNKLINQGFFVAPATGYADLKTFAAFIDTVREEVVRTWQNFVHNEYMPAIIQTSVLNNVFTEIQKKASSVGMPQAEYGNLKHKPYRDLVTGKNVVRMPHEFAIGFRFGHSQLRPSYILNKHHVVLLFKDARARYSVTIDGNPASVSGRDDLRGNRHLECEHVIDWNVFYPKLSSGAHNSLAIDHKVTARVFNLPESAIPDDIKYIGNLPHRNLLRGSQIGVVSGEELAEFYGLTPLTPAQILHPSALQNSDAKELFELEPRCEDKKHDGGKDEDKHFKTPLWFYILKDAEDKAGRPADKSEHEKLGKLGSRLVAEVLAGALYYGNVYPYDRNWAFKAFPGKKMISLHDIIDFVDPAGDQTTCVCS